MVNQTATLGLEGCTDRSRFATILDEVTVLDSVSG